MEHKKLKAHFIGIGGIGISALAQSFLHDGWEVVGTNDNLSPETLDRIRDKGVKIYIEVNIKNIDPDTNLLIYSDAWLTREPEFMQQLRATGIPMQSYFEALGTLAEGKRTIAVAGTHGKTTTSGMLAKILKDAELSPIAIIGSIVADFGSNYLPGTSNLFVVEACEYMRHFLNFTPEILVVTNIEYDHTDYFKNLEDVQSAFRTLMERVPNNGTIVTDTQHPNILPLLNGLNAKIVDYTKLPSYTLLLPGEFNKMNARAAAAAARAISSEIQDSTIVESLQSFHGTWRRFEYKGKTLSGTAVYDDYAHHPTAIRETIRALRARATKEHLTGKIYIVFHPHLYSRTKDLIDGFSQAFEDADKVLLAPIFGAREIDDGSTSSQIVAERIVAQGVHARAYNSFEDIKKTLLEETKENDIIMTMGAGDIYKLANDLIKK